MTNALDDIVYEELEELIKEFGATTEEELEEIQLNNWNICKCGIRECKNMVDICECQWIDGEPICDTHSGGKHANK